jgi:hypothetical protein
MSSFLPVSCAFRAGVWSGPLPGWVNGLVDRYLEFVAGRCRPDTLQAVAFDLKAFFLVIGKDPLEVAAAVCAGLSRRGQAVAI